MTKKIFITGSFLLSAGTFASYLLGAVRDIVFGNFFGVSGLTDAYLGAFLLADILMMIFISSALLGLVTPLYLKEKEKKTQQPEISEQMFGNFFASLLLIFSGALLIAGIFAAEIFPLLSPEIFANYPAEFVFMGQLFLFSNFLFAVSNFLGTYLMAHKNFLSTALAPLFYNIGILAGMMFFADTIGILSAAYGAVFGAFLHMMSRVLEYFFQKYSRENHTFSGFIPHIDFSDPVFRELVISMLWKIGGLIIVPLTFIFFIRISSEHQGLYTAFQYMRNLQSAPIAIFGISLATAVFPLLSQNQAEDNTQKFSQNFWRVFSNILFWTLPSAVGIFFLGSQVLALLYGIEKNSLAFEWIQILSIFLAGILVFEAIFHLLSRSFYSSKDISTPLFGGIIFLISAIGTLFVGKLCTEYSPENSEYLVYFLGAAYFLGYFFQSIFLFTRGFQKKLFSPPSSIILQKSIKTFLWSAIMGIFLFLSQLFPEIFWTFSSDILNIASVSAIAGGIYFLPVVWGKISHT